MNVVALDSSIPQPADGHPASDATRVRTGSRLIAVAARLFRQCGFQATTTRQLSDALGIKKASLYHHIESKQDLLHELCRQGMSDAVLAVSAAADGAGDSAVPGSVPVAQPSRLGQVIAAHLTTTLGDSDIHAVALLEMRALRAEHRDQIMALRDDYQRIVCAVVEEEQAAARVRTDLGAKTITLALLSLLNWTVLWYRPDGDLAVQDLVEAFSTIFLDGVRQ